MYRYIYCIIVSNLYHNMFVYIYIQHKYIYKYHETIQLYHNEFLTKSPKWFLVGMSSTLADDAMSWFLRIGQNWHRCFERGSLPDLGVKLIIKPYLASCLVFFWTPWNLPIKLQLCRLDVLGSFAQVQLCYTKTTLHKEMRKKLPFGHWPI